MTVTRNIEQTIIEALKDTPAVFLAGARQSGKSTLVKQLLKDRWKAEYITLDTPSQQIAAKTDPQGFIDGLPEKVAIDEVQRVPELFPAIKKSIDDNRVPGRFMLTGSAHVTVVPQASESLVGRMEIITLWPFSQGEIASVKETFVDSLFSDSLPASGARTIAMEELCATMVKGGYPEILARPNPSRREAWFRNYLDTLLQREIRELSGIDSLLHMPKMLSLLAGRCASLLNFAEISRNIEISQSSVKRYFAVLEAAFLAYHLPAFSRKMTARIVKAPKVYLNDTGLICFLLGLNEARIKNEPALCGHVLENFVVSEIAKQLTWSNTRPAMYHFRAHSGEEVDLVLENRAGQCVGIEIKMSSSIQTNDIHGLKLLQKTLGPQFIRGIILYPGKEAIPFDSNIHALPLNVLWS